jgi:WD40 repeat protein
MDAKLGTDNGGTYVGKTVVWDSQSGRELITIPDQAASAASWSPDSKRIATAQARVIKIWDWKTGNLEATLVGHRKDVASLAWSPDGRQIASASADLTTRIWDVASKTLNLSFGGHSVAVQRVAWNPIGNRLASIDIFGTTQIYAATPSELMRIARQRVTRPLSIDECRTYLHTERCPTIPEF